MNLVEFKAYHDEVNAFLGKFSERNKQITASELILIYGIRCEQLGYLHSNISMSEFAKISNVVEHEDDIVEVASMLFNIVPKVSFGLDIREGIRSCRTKEDVDKILLELYEKVNIANSNREEYGIETDAEVSEKLLAITTLAMIMDKELFPYFTPLAKPFITKHVKLLANIEEADYLGDGYFAVYPLTTMKLLEKNFSRRKMDIVQGINQRFKEEFLSDKAEKSYTLLNRKEEEALEEIKEFVTIWAATIRCNMSKPSDNIRNKLLEDTENKIIGFLETLQVRQDNLSKAMQDIAFELVDEFDADKVELSKYIADVSDRVILGCKNEIDDILDIVANINAVTMKLSEFNAILDSRENRVNSDKRALLRKYQGVSEANRWIATIMGDLIDTLKYYCKYISSETVELYKQEKPIDKSTEKEIRKVDKNLTNTLRNIYCYKELNKIALDKGYTKVRQKGDHGIFRKSDGSVVVIPQGRAIGKGLSRRIQKDCNRE
ncbi:type II toxin-antitoxin system HicA family toxin [Paraclostridium bifermentans]